MEGDAVNMTNTRRNRRSLLQRVYGFWARRLSMPFDFASTICAALQIGQDPIASRKPRLPAQCATPRVVTFLFLPRNLQEEILRLLPTKDRYAPDALRPPDCPLCGETSCQHRVREVPLVCTQLTTTTRADSPIWEELLIDEQVLGTCLK